MTTKEQITQLCNMATELLNDTETRRFLFSHTQNETEYESMRRALKILAGYRPVEWIGKPGERQAVMI
ncbi:MAG: hypothetical protein WBL02_07450 [Methanomethylovorans sp.]|uniref:hypothetical protein n=1 Tax=Methanomethylovorans sp. TaxID=2758717 RepID=UPI003C71169D